jgi:hypothetical protein
MRSLRAAALAVPLCVLAACSSVPGETTTSRRQQQEIHDRLITMARKANPQCTSPKVKTTEILDVHSDGRSSQELWTLDQCGTPLRYLVSFPVKPGPAAQFSVREEP